MAVTTLQPLAPPPPVWHGKTQSTMPSDSTPGRVGAQIIYSIPCQGRVVISRENYIPPSRLIIATRVPPNVTVPYDAVRLSPPPTIRQPRGVGCCVVVAARLRSRQSAERMGEGRGVGVGVPPLRDLTEDREAAASARSSERLSGCGTNRFGVALRELGQ